MRNQLTDFADGLDQMRNGLNEVQAEQNIGKNLEGVGASIDDRAAMIGNVKDVSAKISMYFCGSI